MENVVWCRGGGARVGLTTTVWAASPQDPATGGQNNKCWGQTASELAKQSDPSVNGGGMGAHTRSETAADINGGFANSTNPFGQDQPRSGVGNVSTDVHGVHPGDGGNGIHAANNGQVLTAFANPVTGAAVTDPADQIVLASDCTPNIP
jgi:hypothetical protein